MGEVIVVASGKGGVGKTITCANLGAALSLAGQQVLLVDMDMGLRNLDIALGLESSIVYDVIDVVEETCTLEQATIKDQKFENLYFIPAAQTRDDSCLEKEQMKAFCERVSARFDYVLLDAPAGLGRGLANAAAGAGRAIIVTMPEMPALRDADRAISFLEEEGVGQIDLVVNRIRPDLMQRGVQMNLDDCLDILQINLLGVIPEDELLLVAAVRGEPVTGDFVKSAKAYSNICARLLGQDIPIMEMDEKQGFWERLKQRFGKKKNYKEGLH